MSLPRNTRDLAALRGETADNIPGVPGVGDGFAAKWINQYGGLEQIIEHADEISGKKGEALRENIEQVKLNRSVNALVRDLDLGVSVSDLTFGQVDAGQLDDLFTKLEFGVRTKNRVLKTFNADKPSGDVHESSKLGLPHVEDVNDPHVVETWVQNHFPVVQEHLHERHERSSNDIPEFGFEIDSSTRCTDKVKQSWTLYAEGTSKPGEASLSALMIAVHGEAIRIDVFSPDMVQCLQRLFDRYHHSMVVHGYKEHAHLLGSIGVELPEPLFDTKLAGYLAHPDFHADTLEPGCGPFP